MTFVSQPNPQLIIPFGTHQGRLPEKLAAAGITDLDAANAYVRDVYLPAFNAEFAQPAQSGRGQV